MAFYFRLPGGMAGVVSALSPREHEVSRVHQPEMLRAEAEIADLVLPHYCLYRENLGEMLLGLQVEGFRLLGLQAVRRQVAALSERRMRGRDDLLGLGYVAEDEVPALVGLLDAM